MQEGRRPARNAENAAARALAPTIRRSTRAAGLLGQLDLRRGQDLLALLLLDLARRLDLLGGLADLPVELLADVVLLQVVGDLLAPFVGHDRVLTGLGLAQRALGALPIAG